MRLDRGAPGGLRQVAEDASATIRGREFTYDMPMLQACPHTARSFAALPTFENQSIRHRRVCHRDRRRHGSSSARSASDWPALTHRSWAKDAERRQTSSGPADLMRNAYSPKSRRQARLLPATFIWTGLTIRPRLVQPLAETISRQQWFDQATPLRSGPQHLAGRSGSACCGRRHVVRFVSNAVGMAGATT